MPFVNGLALEEKRMASKGRLVPGNTKVSILGMLESVKVLEHHFRQKMAVAQRQNDMVAIGEAFGIQIAMTILTAQAVELAIKFAFEQEHPKKVAPRTHGLYELYRSLSMERRRLIEIDYHLKVKKLPVPPPDRRTVESLFLEEADALNWRYVAEQKESGVMITTFPIPFMEAASSVLSTISWPQQETQTTSNSSSPEIYLQQAVQKALRSQFAEAIKDYDQAIGLDPGGPASYYNRGKSKSALGQLTEAVKDFTVARDLAKRTNNQRLKILAQRQLDIHNEQGQRR